MQNKSEHPYMKTLEDTLELAKFKLECLEKRLILIDEEYKTKSDYEKNESELIKITTRSEISAIKRVIKEKESYFINFMKQYVEDMDEIESNFTDVVNKAKEKSLTDPKIKTILEKVVWENLEKNTEAKIYFYKQIKKMI